MIVQILAKLNLQRERPLTVVPGLVLAALLASFTAQLVWHGLQPPPVARAAKLPNPPSPAVLRVISLGEPVALSKFLMLWLQSFDNQPGISIPFKDLNYNRIIAWLDVILKLDPQARYPLLSAARIYADVPDDARSRKMLEFVYREFMLDPNHRWPWMAHAVFVAKHHLYDLNLAMKYARALRKYATAPNVPAWAREMELFIYEDMGDVEDAKILIGGLLHSGVIKDPHELKFFTDRLKKEEAKEKNKKK